LRTKNLPEYKSPQNETPTGRLLLVFLATFVVLILFQPLLKKYGPQPQPQQQQQQQQVQPAPPTSAPPPETAPAQAAVSTQKGKAKGKGGETPAAQVKQATAESETVIESDLYKVTFTNLGGQVKSWILKKYDDDKGKPLDLVHQIAAKQYGYPLSVFTYDENLRKKLNSALYVVTQNGRDVTFEYSDADVTVRKALHFDDTYVAKVDLQVTQHGSTVIAYPSWPAGFGDETTPASYAVERVDYHPLTPISRKWWGGQNEVERLDIKHVSGGNTIGMPFYWAGVSDQYFAAVFLPDDPQNSALVTFRSPLKLPKDLNKPDPNDTVTIDVLGSAVGNSSGHSSLRLFAGPKNLQILQTTHAAPVTGQAEPPPDLSTLLDLGMFSFIVKPLFLWLRWTHNHWVANWGWDIVILTIIINIALLPLRLTSMKSALKTARIQPQMQSIRDKYKKYDMRDPRRQEMNQEIAALMKEHGVNPAGGCLPLLIQFPFLIAFYTMLGNLTELRHAHWFYIHDLSSADPYHVLPLLIIVSTFLVQRMTPQGGMDPQQQKMMNMMMPVMLGVISWNLSSGLCLYWVVGNVVAMLMQMGLNRSDLGRQQREMAAKRARKLEKK
jgi:YidC/Oxa1 family membrane protein insertase